MPLLGAVVASVLVVACVPSSALGAARIGLHAERDGPSTVSEEEILRMRNGGADDLRTSLDWELVEREKDGPRNWENFDNLMRWSSQGDGAPLRVLPILIGSPDWVEQSDSSTEPPVTGEDLQRWSNFVQAAAERYGRGGSFWSDNPELQENPVVDWQVWNEPNLSAFWTNGRQNPKKYTDFLKLTDRTLKAVDPESRTVLAGMPERDDHPKSMDEFLTDLYKVSGFKGAFDVLAVHPFVPLDDKDGLPNAVERIRKLADREGDRSKPILLTELGAASRGPNSPYTANESGQRKALERLFDQVRKVDNKNDVEIAYWHKWRDTDDHPPQIPQNHRWQTYTGLFTKGGRPKSAWGAFTRVAGGEPGSKRNKVK